MSKFKNVLLLALACVPMLAQVGVGTNDPKATLDVVGKPTDANSLDGIIAPRLTGDQLQAKNYTAAQLGAMVYVTAAATTPAGQTLNVTDAGFYVLGTGNVWQKVNFGSGGGTADGNGIYSGDGTITTARNVTLGSGDLTFNGDDLTEGNDVIIGSNSAFRTQGARYKGTQLQGGMVYIGPQTITNDDEVYTLTSTVDFGDVDLIFPDPSTNEGRELTLVNNAVPGAVIELNSILVGASLVDISASNFSGVSKGRIIQPGEVYSFIATNGKWHLQSQSGSSRFRKVYPGYITGVMAHTVSLNDDVVLLEAEVDVQLTFPTCTPALNGKEYTVIQNQAGVITTPNNTTRGQAVRQMQGKDIICVHDGTDGVWQWIGNY